MCIILGSVHFGVAVSTVWWAVCCAEYVVRVESCVYCEVWFEEYVVRLECEQCGGVRVES